MDTSKRLSQEEFYSKMSMFNDRCDRKGQRSGMLGKCRSRRKYLRENLVWTMVTLIGCQVLKRVVIREENTATRSLSRILAETKSFGIPLKSTARTPELLSATDMSSASHTDDY